MNKTDKLVELYQTTEEEVKALEAFEMDSDEAKEKLANIEEHILNKVTQLDVWMGSIKHRISSLEALKEQFKDAIKSIDNKIKKNENTIEFLETNTLPKLVNSKGQLETGYKKYTIYLADGALEITDSAQIPPEFIKTKIEQTIDKAGLKKHIKETGNTSYAHIPKVKRVRIS